MSIVLNELSASKRGQKPYDWDTWLDGRPHLLLQGEQFECGIESMRSMAFTRAMRVGVPLQTRMKRAGDCVTQANGQPLILEQDGLEIQAKRTSAW